MKNFRREQKLIENENIEYCTQKHDMHVEGSADCKPFISEIKSHTKRRGFNASNIDIWFDEFQNVWRFNADLS